MNKKSPLKIGDLVLPCNDYYPTYTCRSTNTFFAGEVIKPSGNSIGVVLEVQKQVSSISSNLSVLSEEYYYRLRLPGNLLIWTSENYIRYIHNNIWADLLDIDKNPPPSSKYNIGDLVRASAHYSYEHYLPSVFRKGMSTTGEVIGFVIDIAYAKELVLKVVNERFEFGINGYYWFYQVCTDSNKLLWIQQDYLSNLEY